MRKASILVGLTLVALATTARAQEGAPAAAAPTAAAVAPTPPPADAGVAPMPALGWQESPASARRVEIGVSILALGAGKFTTPVGGMETTGDAAFAYGAAVSGNYRIVEGLSVGATLQTILNVVDKVNPSQLASPGAAREYDLMARLAYTFPVVETIGLYVEILPGYSLILQPNANTAKGLIFGLGGGVSMGLTDLVFVNLGVGYQLGLQTVSDGGTTADNKTKYLRVALGGGVRF